MGKFNDLQDEMLYAFEGFEIKSDNSKKLIIAGYISTTSRDKMNDVVTDAGQLDLVEQLNRMSITLDLDHDTWRDEQGKTLQSPKALIPAGKIIKAEKHDNGTYVEAEINEFHPFYDKISGSIRRGFLHSFSIAFTPVKAVVKVIDGIKTRLLDKVNLMNVALTGVPVNDTANFSIVTKSFINKQMETEVKSEVVDWKSQFEKVSSEFNELKSQISLKDETIGKLQEELKSLKTKSEESKESKKEEEDEDEKKDKAEMKSFMNEYSQFKKEMAEMKSQLSEQTSVIEKMRTFAMNKAQVEAKSFATVENKQSVMDYIK